MPPISTRTMSCNYAEGLSPYENKGVLGLPEKFDTIEKLEKKCNLLAQMLSQSKHVVVHTGAGISTSAGIPDFRGPNGVWTLEKKGKRPTTNISFTDAKPTKTHMILKKLVECEKVHYIISQNIDGLHLKSGLPRKYLAELHGNMFVDECNVCKRQFIRNAPVETVGKKCSGIPCASGLIRGRPCRGRLYDGVLDWEHDLPENDLLMAECHSSIADLSICLGTTLQIVPSGNLPVETLKYGGKLVVCNLQPTKHDNKADLIINYYVDDILEKVMNILGIDIPEYNAADDITKLAESSVIEWTINRKDVLKIEKAFKAKCKGVKKIRNLIKSKRKSDSHEVDDKSKVCKLEPKDNVDEIVENNKDSTENSKVNDDLNEVTENRDISSTVDVIDVRNENSFVDKHDLNEVKQEKLDNDESLNSTKVKDHSDMIEVSKDNINNSIEQNVEIKEEIIDKNNSSVIEQNNINSVHNGESSQNSFSKIEENGVTEIIM